MILTPGRIAAKAQHVLDASRLVDLEDAPKVLSRVADAREMGHALDLGVPLDPGGDVDRPLPRRSSRTICHRDEARIERDQILQRAEEVRAPRLVLGREELK